MWFTRTADGLRGWFRVEAPNGALRTGLVATDFTVTAVDPVNVTSAIPTVFESPLKPGLYYFDIPSAFLVAGIGEYGITVEVNSSGAQKVRTTFSKVLKVNTKGFEDIGSLTAAQIADAVWDELVSDHLSAGSTGAFLKRILQLAEPDVVVDKTAGTITLKDRTTGGVLVVYTVTGILDTRVEELDG